MSSISIIFFSQFTDFPRTTQNRLTFTTGEFIYLRGKKLARFDLGFIHQDFSGMQRLFLKITRVEEVAVQRLDHLLNLPILRLERKWEIVGLPAVIGKRTFVVPAHRRGAEVEASDPLLNIDRREEFIEVQWDIHWS